MSRSRSARIAIMVDTIGSLAVAGALLATFADGLFLVLTKTPSGVDPFWVLLCASVAAMMLSVVSFAIIFVRGPAGVATTWIELAGLVFIGMVLLPFCVLMYHHPFVRFGLVGSGWRPWVEFLRGAEPIFFAGVSYLVRIHVLARVAAAFCGAGPRGPGVRLLMVIVIAAIACILLDWATHVGLLMLAPALTIQRVAQLMIFVMAGSTALWSRRLYLAVRPKCEGDNRRAGGG